MPLPLNCFLMCASGAAYGIDLSGSYHPDPIFSKAVAYNPAPAAMSSGVGGINACLVGQTAVGIIVAFRGTVWNSGLDWLQDLFALPISVPGLPGLVHAGFAAAVQSLLPEVIKAVNALNPSATNPVYVTGHSKGGGMAPLAAYLLQQTNQIPILQTVTFAAPRSGDAAFAAGYQSVFSNHLRYENYGDLVPLVPPGQVFANMLAKAANRIDVKGQSALSGPDLAKLMTDVAKANYTPVGSELFIDHDGTLVPNEPLAEQVFDFGMYLAGHLFDSVPALVNSHSYQCGHGYMKGACSGTGVCS